MPDARRTHGAENIVEISPKRPLGDARRMSASLIGRLGQVHFIVSFPCCWDHCLSSGSRFSSQSLMARFGWTAACMCRIGCGAPRFVSRLSVAADLFGVIYYLTGHVYMPERAQTSSGEGRSRQLALEGCQIIKWPPKICDGTRCCQPTFGA